MAVSSPTASTAAPAARAGTENPLDVGARRWRGPVTAAALALLVLGAGLGVAGVVPAVAGRIGVAGADLALLLAGSLLAAAAGLMPAALILWCRAGGEAALGRLERLGGWPQAVLAAVLAEAALAAALMACGLPLGATGLPSAAVLGGLVAALGFPLLVFERHLWAAGPELPEAPGLVRLVRLPLVVLAGGGLAAVAAGAGLVQVLWLVRGLAGLTALVAFEAFLRAVGRLFLPPARGEEVRALGFGWVAALILDGWRRNREGPGSSLAGRFGIDLARSWALGFVRRAAVPMALALALLAWGVTGVTVLGPDQRGVYQRLGAPVAVFGPGLTFHLPWPFGLVRVTEFGTVHDLPVVLSATPAGGATGGGATDGAGAASGVDGPAPPEADRLWVEAHPSEASYLIPGSGQGGFELVDLDLRLMYRIGLRDSDAIAAGTNVADPETLVRALAGAWLVRYFSTRTLAGLLREDPGPLAEALRAGLQGQLDLAGSGLELRGVAIDAIHPPPGAAAAYHGVQAAEIQAATEVAEARRTAVTVMEEAREKATMALNLAATDAQERLSNAAIERSRFQADLQARREAGDGVALERRLTVLEQSLGQGALTIVDRHIPLQGETVLDFRPGPNAGPASDAADSDLPARTPPPPPPPSPSPSQSPSSSSSSSQPSDDASGPAPGGDRSQEGP